MADKCGTEAGPIGFANGSGAFALVIGALPLQGRYAGFCIHIILVLSGSRSRQPRSLVGGCMCLVLGLDSCNGEEGADWAARGRTTRLQIRQVSVRKMADGWLNRGSFSLEGYINLTVIELPSLLKVGKIFKSNVCPCVQRRTL